MKRHHQVLILGGGPAGSAAAYTLAQAGVDVGLIDKARFPRDKLCGGLLTLRCAKIYRGIFDRPWDPVISHVSHGVKFLHRSRLLCEVQGASELSFTRRLDFDQFLLDQAITMGTATHLGEAVVALNLAEKSCTLRSGLEIGFDALIGADGVNSLVAKTLFGPTLDPKRVAFALEMEVDRAGQSLDDPEIHLGLARWGYAWVFPKKDTLTVGVGGLLSLNPELRSTFQRFLLERFGHIPDGRVRGHHLPFGHYRKLPGRENVLLCGDAAGLVEPITGEGIAFALLSGQFAAQALLEARGRAAMPGYLARFRKMADDFDHAQRLRYLLFPPLSAALFLKVLPRSQHLAQKHLELMADEIGYREYSRYLISGMLRQPAKWFHHLLPGGE